MGQPLQQVRSQLRQLETRHELVAKSSELSCLLELKKWGWRGRFIQSAVEGGGGGDCEASGLTAGGGRFAGR